MATPAAIAVYTAGTGRPEHVGERPWRGVYHHWDGNPAGLGAHLLERVRRRRGDVSRVVRELIDEAPHGWSKCFGSSAERASESGLLAQLGALLGGRPMPEGERLAAADEGLPVAPDDTQHVAFVYVFDLEARRLDAFATHTDAAGERIGSVAFSARGEADLPALDLLPEELVVDVARPGPEMSPAQLLRVLRALPEMKWGGKELSWVKVEVGAEGSLQVVFHVFEIDDGQVTSIVEQEWAVVPANARREPERVEAFFWALVSVLSEGPREIDPFWIASLDVLRRSGARFMDTFVTVVRAHVARGGIATVETAEDEASSD